MSVVVEQYDSSWPEEFETVKLKLTDYLQGVNYQSIEHVGSTSVPGLVAKPVIDIDIIVTREHVQSVIDALIEKGKYDYLGELGIVDRHAFKDPNRPTRYNIYVCIDDALQTRNHLALRDTLRSTPTLREEYASTKLDLATHSTNIIDYIVGKSSIIQKILDASSLFTAPELASIHRANTKGSRYGAITTPRLLLREFVMSDIPSYHALESSEETTRYQAHAPLSLAQSRHAVIANIRNHNDTPRTIYELAVQHRSSHRFIGRVGARTSQANSDSLPGEATLKQVTHADLWCSFLPEAWGRGYATEAMAAFVEALKERLQGEGKVELQMECDPRNERAVLLGERLGFERAWLVRGVRESKGGWVDCLVLTRVVGDV